RGPGPEQQRGVLCRVVGAAAAWVVVGARPHHGAAGLEKGCSSLRRLLPTRSSGGGCCHAGGHLVPWSTSMGTATSSLSTRLESAASSPFPSSSGVVPLPLLLDAPP
ncbi:hypothetical protein PC111_g24780, partial [Phytophthora cactorum]